jgi:type III secretion protein T
VSQAALIELARHELVALVFTAVRMMAILLILPAFTWNAIPGLVRTGIATGLVLIVQPTVSAELDLATLGLLESSFLIAKEVLIGGLIGLAIGTVFWGAEGAGFFIDNHRGAAIASSVNPLTGSESSPFGILFLQAFTVYFFASGAFLVFLGLVYDTYVLWPPLTFVPQLPPDIVPFTLGLIDKVMYLSLVLAGPVVIAMFLSELGLALVSRFAPQLNVFVLAMPVKSGVALFILVLYGPFLFAYFRDQLREIVPIFMAVRTLIE